MARLQEKYKNEIVAKLKEELELENIMQVPRVEKVVINSGVGEAVQNKKILDKVVQELTTISGQKPVVRKAKKSIANFRLREGMPIGASVTLRGIRMYEFLDRIISVVLPRIKDFRGVPVKSFDGSGNYTFAVKDQLVFPEIDYNKVDRTSGMSITIVTSATSNKAGEALLRQIGMPFSS